MNAIPEGFRFSQSSLSAFTQCKRRFMLRYLRRVEWPAPVTAELEHWERAIERGLLFHHWTQQKSLGLDVDAVASRHEDEMLVKWWQNYCEHPPQGIPPGQAFSEIQLSAPVGKFRLIAKFDRLVFAEDGRVYIVDWKTGRRRPQHEEYARSWQTLVYRYIAVEAGVAFIGGRAVAPVQGTLL